MKQSDMIARINARIDDQVDLNDAVGWLNDGKNMLAIAVEADFPDLTTDGNSTFAFPERYHLAPVLYACARYKEADQILGEASNFLNQFEEMKKDFVKTYQVPPRYRDDNLSQNFVPTEGQTDFTVTKIGFSPDYNRLKIYVNDIPTKDFSLDDHTFKLDNTCKLGDTITAVWEEHADIIEPPYSWFKNW